MAISGFRPATGPKLSLRGRLAVAISEALGDRFATLAMTYPPTPIVYRANVKKVRNNTAVPQQGDNDCFLGRKSIFLDRGPLNG